MTDEALPVVSVVIVAMNDEVYIAETIESALTQEYPRIQIHVQHGAASRDATLSIVRNYPVRWASELDTGFPDAANRGIDATDGEIVLVEGGDDPLLPGAIRTLVEALRANPHAGFAYGDIQYIDAMSRPFYELHGRPLDLDELFWFNHVTSQRVAMRRAALVSAGNVSHGNHQCRLGSLGENGRSTSGSLRSEATCKVPSSPGVYVFE